MHGRAIWGTWRGLTRAAAALSWALLPVAAAAAAEPAAEPPRTPPMDIHRAAGKIEVDGDLNDAGWQGALSFDKFVEGSPGDNIPAKVKTTVWLTYDDKYFYIAVKADDPEPQKIRAPYVDRDLVLGTDDNIAVFLDTRNDRRSALELRVSPRGIQADGMYNDANGNEDFSPDFFYDTAAKITSEGWQAEYRIPFSSLRYPKQDPQSWGILVWRNYPRDYRYAFYSSPVPRGSNCLICWAHEIRGFTGLPNTKHLVVAPYVNAERQGTRTGGPDSPFAYGSTKLDGGVDVKWNPTANSAIDATINPDFSQIESDVAQISANQRFALFYPEKRPFFLEGVDLFDTQIQAVYTRTLTDPAWGLRATDQEGGTAYTVLVAQDRGGGSVILPGPESSSFAPQDYKSTVAIGRLRRDFGASFGGLLFTDREIEGGGHNRVVGPDFQWRQGNDLLTGQFLWSDTENPNRPDLSPAFLGQKQSSHAAVLSWDHNTQGYDWHVTGRDFGDQFRADEGFVTQNGYRELSTAGALRFYPEGLLRYVRTFAFATQDWERGNGSLGHEYGIGLLGLGSRNLTLDPELHHQEVRVGDRLLTQRYLFLGLQIDPNRVLSRIGLQATAGEQIDFDNARVGHGASLYLYSTVRPTVHLETAIDLRRSWLNVDGGRLFTAQIERLRATYVFNARALVRLIGQYVRTDYDPALYTFPVPERTGGFSGSALFSYKLNWQTVLFIGYGDNRALSDTSGLYRTDNSVFVKISYAIQR
ncbi:MAG: DUF5916 domain-containing protein [Acidobacteriota bacterium]